MLQCFIVAKNARYTVVENLRKVLHICIHCARFKFFYVYNKRVAKKCKIQLCILLIFQGLYNLVNLVYSALKAFNGLVSLDCFCYFTLLVPLCTRKLFDQQVTFIAQCTIQIVDNLNGTYFYKKAPQKHEKSEMIFIVVKSDTFWYFFAHL